MPKKTDPFDIFKSSTVEVKVKELGGATVTIKTALSVAEQLKIDEIMYANMGANRNGRAFFNPADQAKSQVQAVSFLLVSPKKTIAELSNMEGATKAISEIYDAYLDQLPKEATEGK